MQLTFPNGEHPDVAFDHGEVTVGARVAQGVSLPDSGLSPHHASFLNDRRGLWLRVPPGTPAVHLNARPVRRIAMLRIGDQVCLGKVQVVIGENASTAIDRRIPPNPPAALNEVQKVSAARVVLRGLSGSHFGRSFTLTEPRVVGKSPACDLRIEDPALADRHAQFELHGDRVVLRSLSANDGTWVNGVPVRDAVLAPGDQILIDQHRFVLEAPGLPPRGQDAPSRSSILAHTQTMKAVKAPIAPDPAPAYEPEPSAPSDPGALWWLIAAAAVLAAALTALLVYSPKLGA